MCGFAVEGVPRKKTRCGLAGESGGGAGSAVEVEESEPSDGRADDGR
jgi:hypothetical protein